METQKTGNHEIITRNGEIGGLISRARDKPTMHRRVEWMVAADDAVLHVLAQTTLEISSRDIAYNLGYDPDYMGKRCRKLAREGLLSADDDNGGPFYQLSDFGREYVNGNLTPDDLE